MKAVYDKKAAAVAELLKDFSIRNFRIAGRTGECIAPAVQTTIGQCPGLPRSAVTEIWGPPSSGKTSLMLTYFAQASQRPELCALVDATDAFDPVSASRSGVDLDNLLWVRCGARIETALKTTDILLHGGGFGLTALDLGDITLANLGKIPMMYWYRFRRAAEETRTAFLILASAHVTASCAALVLAGTPGAAHWSGTEQFRILQTLQPRFEIARSEHSGTGKSFSVKLRHAASSF